MKASSLLLAVLVGGSASGEPLNRTPKAVGTNPHDGLARLEFAHLLGDPSFKHAHSLTHIEALPDGRLLSASEDGSARIWDLATGNELARFSHRSVKVWNAIPLPDNRIATAADKVCIWDASTAEPLLTLEYQKDAFRLAAIPDTTLLASGHDGSAIVIRDWETGQTVRELTYAKDEVYTLVAPSRERLIASGDDGVIQLWDLGDGEELKRVELEGEPRVSTISLSPGRDRILVNAGSKLLCLKCADLETVWTVDVGSTSYVSGWSPDGSRAALCSGDRLLAIDPENGETVWEVDVPHGKHRAVSYGVDGDEIFTGGDEMVYRFSAADGALLFPKHGKPHARGLRGSVAFSADSSRAFSGSIDGFVYPFDTASGRAADPWPTGHESDFLALAPGGSLVVADGDGKITRFVPSGGGEVASREGIGSFSDFALGAGGVLLTGANNSVRRWLGGEAIGFLGGEGSGVESVSASADGRRVATASEKTDALRIWDPETGALLQTIGNEISKPDFIMMFPDGRGVSLIDDRTVYTWFAPEPIPLPKDADVRIEKLFRRLAEDAFEERERARQAIVSFGPDALPLVEQHSAISPEIALQLAQVRHRLQNLVGGALTETLAFQEDISSMAGSPDGRHWAATLGNGHRSELVFGSLDREDGQLKVLHSFSSPNGARDCVFSPDGKFLLTGNRTTTASLYRVVPAAE